MGKDIICQKLHSCVGNGLSMWEMPYVCGKRLKFVGNLVEICWKRFKYVGID